MTVNPTELSEYGTATLAKQEITTRFEFDVVTEENLLWQKAMPGGKTKREATYIRPERVTFNIRQDGDGERKLRRVEVWGHQVLKDGKVSDRNAHSITFTSAYLWNGIDSSEKEQRLVCWNMIVLCGMQQFAMVDQNSDGNSWWDATDVWYSRKSKKKA